MHDFTPALNADFHPGFQVLNSPDLGIVASQLGTDGKPEYAPGSGSTHTTNGPSTTFNDWYAATHPDVGGLPREAPFSLTPGRNTGPTVSCVIALVSAVRAASDQTSSTSSFR